MKIENRIELAKKKYGIEPSPEMLCSKWDNCSCNICPLDSKMSLRTTSELDPQTKCKEYKKLRLQIGTYFKLENKGLKSRELSAMKRWKNMSEKEREARKQKLRENSPFIRLKRKGYGITRLKKESSVFTLTGELKTAKNSIPEANNTKRRSEYDTITTS